MANYRKDIDLHKIDGMETDGLAGVHDSLAYRVEEIEKHFHNEEQAFGNASNAMLADEPVKFTVTGGSNAWGTELMLTDGTVIESGSATMKFDLNHLYAVSSSAANKISIIEISTAPINTGVACTFDFTAGTVEDMIVSADHGLANGDRVVFKAGGGALPAEILGHVVYYVVNKAAGYFQVSLTVGGAVFPFTDDGGAAFWFPVVSSVQSAAKTCETKKPHSMASTFTDSRPFAMLMKRRPCNERVFIRAKSETGSTIAIGFLIGLHTYEA